VEKNIQKKMVLDENSAMLDNEAKKGSFGGKNKCRKEGTIQFRQAEKGVP